VSSRSLGSSVMRRCSSGSDGPNFDHDPNPIGRSCDPPRITWQFRRAEAMILYSENVIYRNKESMPGL
jgi:hypothetical protein